MGDSNREEVSAKRTTEGTFPPGSMWTANPIYPYMEEGGIREHAHGHIIDLVHVPSTLEPGDYVLSFRWDFCIGFTNKDQNSQRKTCYAQHTQIKAIRKKMVDIITREIGTVD